MSDNVDRKPRTGKLPLELVSALLPRQAAAGVGYGADKYKAPASWRHAEPDDLKFYIAAAERHLLDLKACYVEGDESKAYAPDSQLHHVAHLAATVSIIIEFLQGLGVELPEEWDKHWLRDPADPRYEGEPAPAPPAVTWYCLAGCRRKVEVFGQHCEECESKWAEPRLWEFTCAYEGCTAPVPMSGGRCSAHSMPPTWSAPDSTGDPTCPR